MMGKGLFNKCLLDDRLLIGCFEPTLYWRFPLFQCFVVFCSNYYKILESIEIKESSDQKDCAKYCGFTHFLVSKFCENAQFPQFRENHPKLYRSCTFPQNSRKLGEMSVFCAVKWVILYISISKCCRTL